LLAHHLGSNAIPWLLEIFAQASPVFRNQARESGEIITWLCHHPNQKVNVITALEELERSGARWDYDERQTLQAVKAGKRHFWSNG